MQWVQQMPNGLMTVQRLVCPAASEMGGLAAPDGVLAIDWQCIDQVVSTAPTSISEMQYGSPKPRPRHVRHRMNSFLLLCQVMARPEASQAAPEFRPGLQGDRELSHFRTGAPPSFHAADPHRTLAARFPRPPTATAAAAPELGAIAAEADAEADAEAAELGSKLA